MRRYGIHANRHSDYGHVNSGANAHTHGSGNPYPDANANSHDSSNPHPDTNAYPHT